MGTWTIPAVGTSNILHGILDTNYLQPHSQGPFVSSASVSTDEPSGLVLSVEPKGIAAVALASETRVTQSRVSFANKPAVIHNDPWANVPRSTVSDEQAPAKQLADAKVEQRKTSLPATVPLVNRWTKSMGSAVWSSNQGATTGSVFFVCGGICTQIGRFSNFESFE